MNSSRSSLSNRVDYIHLVRRESRQNLARNSNDLLLRFLNSRSFILVVASFSLILILERKRCFFARQEILFDRYLVLLLVDDSNQLKVNISLRHCSSSSCYEPGSRYTSSGILLRILRGYTLDSIGTFTRTSAYIPGSPYCI